MEADYNGTEQQKWSKLTDDGLFVIASKTDELVCILQMNCSNGNDQAETKLAGSAIVLTLEQPIQVAY